MASAASAWVVLLDKNAEAAVLPFAAPARRKIFFRGARRNNPQNFMVTTAIIAEEGGHCLVDGDSFSENRDDDCGMDLFQPRLARSSKLLQVNRLWGEDSNHKNES